MYAIRKQVNFLYNNTSCMQNGILKSATSVQPDNGYCCV